MSTLNCIRFARRPSSLQHLIAVAAIVVVVAPFASAQDAVTDRGVVISGHVHDQHDQPVPNALVFVSQHETGLPIDEVTRAPYRLEDSRSGHGTVWTMSDNSGAFAFRDLPAGMYRLFAQAWAERQPIKKASDANGLTVDLLGSADKVMVPSDAARTLRLKPAGSGTLTLTSRDIGNDECFVFLSRAIPQDPVLGPVGWVGPFLGNQIGFNRMLRGRTVFRGLPDGEFGAAFFAADNSPGFGAARGSIEARTRREAVVQVTETDMIAGWSNARKTPHAELQPLVDQVRALLDQGQEKAVWTALVVGTDLADDSTISLKALQDGPGGWSTVLRLGPWDRKVTLPGGTVSTFGKVLAAYAYLQIEQRTKP